MTTSEHINELAAALAKAQGAMRAATKDSTNPFFRSKYADLASVKEAIREPFAENGLSMAQFPTTEFAGTPEPYEWTAKSGETRYGVRVVCIVSVLTRILHASGQWMEDGVSTMLPTGDPQSVGSAISYLRRYALQSVAGVAADDDDGEAAHGRGATKAVALKAPDGYEDWLTDLTAVAENGEETLRKTWEHSPKAFRAHLLATNQAAWDALKLRAASATSLLA